MGTSITSPVDMVTYASVLRRAAKAQAPELAAKIQSSASALEKVAMNKVSPAGPKLGALLDTFV